MTELPPDYFDRPLAEVDPEIAEVLENELHRQQRTLEMIASENFVPARGARVPRARCSPTSTPRAIPAAATTAAASTSTSPSSSRSTAPRSCSGPSTPTSSPTPGAQANAAVYHALLQPGDTIMGLELSHGGHLSHGMKLNVSGRLYDVVPYHVDRESHRVDMDEVERLAKQHRPALIIAGWSAYPRQLDFERFAAIAKDVGAYLMVDMAHFAGLVAAGLHPSPVPHADVVTTTVHKTLGGARSGHDPLPGGVREEDQLRRLPRPAGRAADARRRGQGGHVPHRDDRGLPGAPAAHDRRARAPSPTRCSGPATASTS